MHEGRPVSYLLLAKATPVYASDGEVIGRVRKVLCEPAADIFDGLEIATAAGDRYVPAERVAAIHERGVDLSISHQQLADLPVPRHSRRVRWDLVHPPPHLWQEVAQWLLEHLPPGHPAGDARLRQARERLAARQRAIELARKDPRLAAAAGIGRADVSGSDACDLIAVNNAPADVIAMLPGIDEPLAQQIVRTPQAIGGFVSLEELGMVLDLPGDVVEHLRDRPVFLPG